MATNRFHVEAWSLPLETTTKTVARVPYIAGTMDDELDRGGISRGQITVRADWDRLAEVTDPANDVESLFRVFQDNVLVGSFFGRRFAEDVTDQAQGLVTITGAGLADYIFATTDIENFDYPTNPTVDPDWIWGTGSTLNGFRNGDFEESEFVKGKRLFDVATQFEDGSMQGWSALSTATGRPTVTSAPTVDDADAHAGTYSLVFTPGQPTSGIYKRVRVHGGETYTFTVRIKSTTTGKRFLFGVNVLGGTTSHTNDFVVSGFGYAELANAAEGAGSTDASWQLCALTVAFPLFDNAANEAETILTVTSESAGVGPEVRADTFSAVGPGLGLLPWRQQNVDHPPLPTFEQDTLHVNTGTYSAHLVTDFAFEGLKQRVSGITPGRVYTFTAWVYHEAGSNQDFRIRMRRGDGDGLLKVETYSVPTATWTELTVFVLVDQEEILFDITKSTTGEFWVDTAAVHEGMPAASWGDINIQLLDDLTTNHTGETPPYALDALGFLDYTSFTAALDSAGNAWSPATVEYKALANKKFKSIATDGERAGFEWEVRDNVSTGPAYNIYNPHDWVARTGGIGINLVGTGVPDLRYGAGVSSGPIVKAPSGANRVHITGADGRFDISIDQTRVNAFGTRMLAENDANLLGVTTLGQVADRLLEERTEPVTAVKVNIEPKDDPDVPTPYVHFNVGDTYPIDLIGKFSGSKRVVKITTDFSPGLGRYTVEFDNRSYTSDPKKALAEAVRRLLERFDELDGPVDGSGAPDEAVEEFLGTGSIPTFLIASADARPEIQAIADFVCDGIDDQDEIELALTAMAATPYGQGRFVFSAGDFNCTAAVDFSGASFSVLGMGQDSTYLYFEDVTGLFALKMGNFSVLRDLTVFEFSSGG